MPTAGCIAEIAKCSQLQELRLENIVFYRSSTDYERVGSLSSYFVTLFTNCRNLSLLNLSGCKGFCDQDMTVLLNHCWLIESLYIDGCSITGKSIVAMRVRSIKRLSLMKCKRVSNHAIVVFLGNLARTSLLELNLPARSSENERLTKALRNFKNARHDQFYQCWKMDGFKS